MPERLWGPGKCGAVSLTFDDGLPCQFTNALPELDKRGVKATFFLVTNPPWAFVPAGPTREEWCKVGASGHEIGSHSVNHLKAATLTPQAAAREAFQSKFTLEQTFHVPVTSFCYPYTDAIPVIQTAVRNTGYLQARGGRVARQDKFIPFGDNVNLMNVPCFHLGPQTVEEAPDWILEAVQRRAWFTLMIHGIGLEGTWDNIPTERFAKLLDDLQAADLWIAPFGTVAEFFRSMSR